MRTCFLHIGPHKTGTSTLQTLLFLNRDVLQAAGIYVPGMKAAKNGGNHHRLAQDIGSPGTTGYCRELADELSAAAMPEQIVMSSESLSSSIEQPEFRTRLYQYFHELGYRVTVIAYIRPQVSRANSIYTQAAKTLRKPQTFQGFLARFMTDPMADLTLKFGPLLNDERFRSLFRPFNDEILGRGLCEDFLATLGLPPETMGACKRPPVRNETPDPKTMAALLDTGMWIESTGLIVRPARLVPVASALRKMAVSLGWNTCKYDGATRAEREAIVTAFAASNEAFARRFWNRSWQELFGASERAEIEKPQCIFDPVKASSAVHQEFQEFCGFARSLVSARGLKPETPRAWRAGTGGAARLRRQAQRSRPQ